ncbi:MAG: hypothetical protein P4L10_02785 [Acidobacteriaceae bacterium]|nr:hypothetical protein [Acidobacteriaceae bacterium]
MRIPFPERITPWHAGLFAILLCVLEVLQGTQPLFAAFVFIYIMLATLAFNLAGGLYRASGAYVFANAILGLIFSQCAKVFLGEPADLNLRAPMTTILVYTAGMGSILAAVAISRRVRLKVPLLERGHTTDNIRQMAIGCITVGIALSFVLSVIGNDNGSIGAVLNQFVFFLPLGMLLAVYDEIRSSGGRRSVNLFLIIGSLFMILYGGILGTSKQAIFTPLVAYVVVCGALRYKFKLMGLAAMALVTFFMLYYLVPYSQVVRNYTRDLPTYSERIDAANYWLSHIDDVRTEYKANDEDIALDTAPHYYTQDRGFLERLGMVAMDDALIDATDSKGKFGYSPMVIGVLNLVPHFIWPNKPSINVNNVFAHEIGLLSDEDFTTSVSFGPSADAYHEGKWAGVLILMPLVMVTLFIIADSVTGSVRRSPWGFAFLVYFLHLAPEGSLGTCLTVAFTVTGILIVTVFATRYALPLVGSLIFPERRKTVAVRKVSEFPKRAAPPPAETTV